MRLRPAKFAFDARLLKYPFDLIRSNFLQALDLRHRKEGRVSFVMRYSETPVFILHLCRCLSPHFFP
ncbi:hypothetical protein BOC42_27840 [Burkholderia pseudomallei]|nr:hypothetical protein BOC42_27840 [Burkholderia pseudomallei]